MNHINVKFEKHRRQNKDKEKKASEEFSQWTALREHTVGEKKIKTTSLASAQSGKYLSGAEIKWIQRIKWIWRQSPKILQEKNKYNYEKLIKQLQS